MSILEINDLHVSIEDKEIIKGVSLKMDKGEVHALMGPNGSGKSTLSFALAGHPKYEITKGEVIFDGKNLLEMDADVRARTGLFLAFQYPSTVPGITVGNFLRTALNARMGDSKPGEVKDKGKVSAREFLKLLRTTMKELSLPEDFAFRYLNEGFSGGEKKRVEILQLSILKPTFAILDETDSGLDIDAMKIVADGVNRNVGTEMGALVITHYQRLLNYIKPDKVHIMLGGRLVTSGGPDLALKLEESGYEWVRKEFGSPEDQVAEEEPAPTTN